MFEIILYSYRGENNRVDKNVNNLLITLGKLVGTLKDSTSIINPTIIFDNRAIVNRVVTSNVVDVVTEFNDVVSFTKPITEFNIENSLRFDVDIIKTFNYCYIPEFKRYYFIENITSIRNNIWEIEMKVDVLMSYKDIILGQEVLVSRNEKTFNSMLVDENIISRNEYSIEKIPFVGDFFNVTDEVMTYRYIIYTLSKL